MIRSKPALINTSTESTSVLSCLARLASIIVVVLALIACGTGPDSDEEGGVIGTGILLKGTASTTKQLASRNVQIKSLNGNRATPALLQGNRFASANAGDSGPWVLRVALSNNQFVYGLSYGNDTSNINTYSDLILRNWFAREGLDIDTAFAKPQQFKALPTATEFESIETAVFNIVKLVLDTYQISGDDILRSDYPSNDTGIDLFLDRNPVVTSDNSVTLLVTDPGTETQSALTSQLALNGNFSQRDNTPPSKPAQLRVLGSSLNELVAVWDTSSDDTAVVSYEIFRDDVSVSITPYPVYIDLDVAPGREYRYKIIARDIWGNQSIASDIVVGTTLIGTDTTPPPQPTMLLATNVSSDRIDLIWGYPDVRDFSDVVRFILSRGSTKTNLQPMVRLTSNYATDTNVSSGTNYCYQVSAQDASNNLSIPSEILCVGTASSSINETTPGANELAIPAVESIPCENILLNQDINNGTVLQSGCYRVIENLIVNPTKNLTLSAGTILKFDKDIGIEISNNASFTSNGTKESPVVLTGMAPIPGYWEGVIINRSNSRANLIRNTVIEYAGGPGESGAIDITSTEGEPTRIRLENSLLQWSSGYGLVITGNGTIVESFSGNVLTNNQRPASMGIQYLQSVTNNNSFSGNTTDQIATGRNTFGNSIIIPDLGVPLRSNGFIMNNAALTIEPGVQFIFFSDTNTAIMIDSTSKILAQGSEEKPILFQAESNISGSWGGITIASNNDNILDHVIIENAGGISTGFASEIDNGAIRLQCSGNLPASVTLANTHIDNSLSWGIYRDAPGCTVNIADSVQFMNNRLGNINQP